MPRTPRSTSRAMLPSSRTTSPHAAPRHGPKPSGKTRGKDTFSEGKSSGNGSFSMARLDDNSIAGIAHYVSAEVRGDPMYRWMTGWLLNCVDLPGRVYPKKRQQVSFNQVLTLTIPVIDSIGTGR